MDRRRLRVVAAAGLAVLTALVVGLLAGPVEALLVVLAALLGGQILLSRRQTMAVLARSRGAEKKAKRQADGLRAELARVDRRHQLELHQLVGQLETGEQATADLVAKVVALQKLIEEHNPPRPKPVDLRGAALTDVGPLVGGEDTFTALRLEQVRPQVVLVLDSLDPDKLFAGIATALVTGLKMAARLDRALRIVVMHPLPASPQAVARSVEVWVRDNVPDSAGVSISVVPSTDVPSHVFQPEDLWLVTFWSTAHAVAEAVRQGLVDAGHVIYLVQDYEPGFFPWGSRFALATGTYRNGFTTLVNSRSLADYVEAHTETQVDPAHVFRPDIDTARLATAAGLWRPADPDRPRVLLYGRPGKPRNMFDLTLAALTEWLEQLPEGVEPELHSAGEDHAPVRLRTGHVVNPLGKLTFAEYYDVLTRTDLGIALMHSPHPGHLALELPMSGIPTVTNTFEGFRVPWVDGLELGAPTPVALAEALQRAYERSRSLTVHQPAGWRVDLGRPLDEVIPDVLAGVPC